MADLYLEQTPNWKERASAATQEYDSDQLGKLWSELTTLSDGQLSPDAKAAIEELSAFRAQGSLGQETNDAATLRRAKAYAAIYPDRDRTTYEASQQVYFLTAQIDGLCDLLEYQEGFSVLREAELCQEVIRENLRSKRDENQANTQGYLDYTSQSILLKRARLFREIGLIDRSEVDFHQLLETRERAADWAKVSNWYVLDLRQFIDLAHNRWTELEEWILEELPSDVGKVRASEGSTGFRVNQYAQLLYRAAHAAFERDRSSSAGQARARQRYQEILGFPEIGNRTRFMSHLRLAEVAVHAGDLEFAHEHLIAADREVIRSAEEGDPRRPQELADWSVVAIRLARAGGPRIPDAERRLIASWDQIRAAWAEAPPRPGGSGPLYFRNPQRALGEVLRLQVEPDGIAKAFQTLSDAHAAGTLSKELTSLGRIRKDHAVSEGEAQLTYLVTYEGTHAFLCTQEALDHAWIETPEAELSQTIDSLQRLLTTSPKSRAAPPDRKQDIELLASQLSKILLPEHFRGHIAASPRLTICGVEQLDHLPFEALRLGAKPLGLTHEISYLPGLPLDSQLQYEGSPEISLLLASGESGVLVDSGWEQELIAPYTSAVVLRGEAATQHSIDDQPARVLQLFGHGYLDYTQEIPAGVVLDGSRFGYSQADELSTFPDLALITACGTWQGPDRRGDGGVGHLASAFLRNGTRTVVLPHADIEVQSTLEWSAVFHRALRSGATPAAAALEARRSLASTPDYPDPFYHSLIHVVGKGHVAIFLHDKEQAGDKIGGSSGEAPGPHSRVLSWLVAIGGLSALLVSGTRLLRRRQGQAA